MVNNGLSLANLFFTSKSVRHFYCVPPRVYSCSAPTIVGLFPPPTPFLIYFKMREGAFSAWRSTREIANDNLTISSWYNNSIKVWQGRFLIVMHRPTLSVCVCVCGCVCVCVWLCACERKYWSSEHGKTNVSVLNKFVNILETWLEYL